MSEGIKLDKEVSHAYSRVSVMPALRAIEERSNIHLVQGLSAEAANLQTLLSGIPNAAAYHANTDKRVAGINDQKLAAASPFGGPAMPEFDLGPKYPEARGFSLKPSGHTNG